MTDDDVLSPAAPPQGETCVEPGSLASAFGVDFAVTPGATCVALNDAGHVVSGHLVVFAARSAGRMVRTAPQAFDPEKLHAAAVVEHDHCRTVGKAVSQLCGHAARLGVEAGKSKAAIAQGLRVSRSLVTRSAAVTALRSKHPDIALSKSHFEAVLSLGEPEQVRFLGEAAQRGLSVRELEDLVATAHPERRRQRRGEETLAELMEVAGLADRLGDTWKQDRRGCVAAERRFLRLILDRAAHLLPVPRGTDSAG